MGSDLVGLNFCRIFVKIKRMAKYYIVPADIIESNFPDDLDKMIPSMAIIETEKTITEIAEELIK
jgi:hypothetical protein